MTTKKKTPRERLVERYGKVPRALDMAIAPDKEMARALHELGEDAPYDGLSLADFKRGSREYKHDIHTQYWNQCIAKQKENREIFLRWMRVKPLPWTKNPPAFVWELAEALFQGLRLPDHPYKHGPTGAKKRARLSSAK
jgi:hypothetical protein